jgi:hypothetical protein
LLAMQIGRAVLRMAAHPVGTALRVARFCNWRVKGRRKEPVPAPKDESISKPETVSPADREALPMGRAANRRFRL